MARLQILELPEGASDDRAPFVLVIDQYEPPPYPGEPWPQQFDGVAEKIGARAVLAFETTIDIPANDTTAYVRESGEWSTPNELRAVIQEEIAKAQAELIDTLNRQPRQ